MSPAPAQTEPPILILATGSCAYIAADAVGQAHLEHPANTYVMRVPAPVVFPDSFYYDCFEKGFAGIIVMSCGHECPYPGAFERLTKRIDRVRMGMKERGLDPGRLRLTAVCTVCTKAYLKEINAMDALVRAAASAAAVTADGGDVT